MSVQQTKDHVHSFGGPFVKRRSRAMLEEWVVIRSVQGFDSAGSIILHVSSRCKLLYSSNHGRVSIRWEE